MSELFIRGGVMMYPIVLCSVIGWAIFLERIFAYYQYSRRQAGLHQEVEKQISRGTFTEALDYCRTQDLPLARILAVVLKNRGRGRSELKSLAEEVGEREAVALQRYLGLLGTIANITPLLGLLGTVLGMIKAFNIIAAEGMGTAANLGGGISEALITTAAGLAVAVPMILVHRYLSSRSERLILLLEESSLRIIDLMEA